MKGQFLGLPFAREGVRFALPLMIVTGVFAYLGWIYAALFFLVVSVFVVAFFRDPERAILETPGGIVSPADGKVVEIKEVDSDYVYGEPGIRVSIFLNVFNVHVNRAPIGGKVLKKVYNKGKFLNAAVEKASLDNEQNSLLIETEEGKKIMVRQIAGLIARRILCWVGEGERVEIGERFGLIRFGSRTDLFFPLGSEIAVKVGDKVKGGIHLIGRV